MITTKRLFLRKMVKKDFEDLFLVFTDPRVMNSFGGLEHMEISGKPEVEPGYDLRSDYWGQGLATEAALAVRDFAFGELAFSRLISLIRPTNVASRRVAEKIGMAEEQQIRQGDQSYLVYALSQRDT